MNHGEAPSEPFIADQLGYMLKKKKEKKTHNKEKENKSFKNYK
jgi:hypothetical protein